MSTTIEEKLKHERRKSLKLQQRMDEQQALIDNFVKGFDIAYKVNMDTDTFSVLRSIVAIEGYDPGNTDFAPIAKYFVGKIVFERDRNKMRTEIGFERIRQRVVTEPEYTVEYRDILHEFPIWNEMTIRSLDESNILIGFAPANESIILKRLNRQMQNDIFALYSIDIDAESVTILRPSEVYPVGKVGDCFPYAKMMTEFAMAQQDEAREFFLQMADIENLKEDFRTEDKRAFSFKSTLFEGGRWVSAKFTVIARNEDGNAASVTLGFNYLDSANADRQELKRQLKDALGMAQSANRAKTIFLNNMSHDIRTPMNAIIGYTALATSHINNKGQVQDYLEKIAKSSDHLLSLINDVLDMSRIESGKMNLEEKEENLPDIIQTLKDIIQADIKNKHHHFFIEAGNVDDEKIICDKLRLNQILLNILSNAVKYTPRGGTISMRISEISASPDGYATYEFRVKDNGMGMSPEFAKNLFVPFARENTTTVSGIQGSGLGMAITKKLVDMMGGNISVQSEPGKGTEVIATFDFKLYSNPVQVATEPATEEDFNLEGKKILLVEDNELNLEIATAILEEFGCIVTTAEDGDIAVNLMRKASKGDYDIVLMDIQMPTLNGYEATRQIRSLGTEISRIPIIAMTANAFEEDRKAALEAGMNEHIAKPIDIDGLKAVLSRFLK